MHLLLVEDDVDLSYMLTMLCEFEGHSVVRAAHGREALDLLRGGVRPDVILLDLMMPVMDGWGFRDAQRRDPELAEIPVIVVSAVADTPRVREIDAVASLKKPVNFDELLAAVNAVRAS